MSANKQEVYLGIDLGGSKILTAVVDDSMVSCVVDTIINTNQTGMPGDGKVYVLPVADAVRVRTGETGEQAIA